MSVSVGSIVGAVGGAVIGFFVGGWWGIYYGAVIGFTLGSIIDPVSPDVASPGSPFQPIQVTTNEIGFPIPDLLGTGKISGNLLCYGKEFAYAIEDTVGGKGSDTDKVTVGYLYYASWAIGICLGPVDALLTVYRNDKAIWSGELERPASGGESEVTLPNMGKMTFYFGTDDQAVNSRVGQIIENSALNSANRGLCWAVFENCSMGQYNRMPTMKFVVRKQPTPSFGVGDQIIQVYDYNPVHAIWYILCELAGLPLSWINTTNFEIATAELLSEARGMSILFDRQNSAMNYLEMINKHIDGIMKYGTDNQFHVKLLRDDYDINSLPLIDEAVLLEDPTFTRKSWIDTMNEIKVQYTELIGHERTAPVDGTLYGTGLNGNGQLALGDTVNRSTLTLSGTATWKQVACGGGYTMVIDINGDLWAVGNNTDGQLGIGGTSHAANLTKVPSGTRKWKQVACGSWHTFAIAEDDTLWATGKNQNGQLGLGYISAYISNFVQIGTDTWSQVSCGGAHTFGITTSGSLKCTGANSYGQLGLGDTTDRNVFTQAGNAKYVSCGQTHTMFINLYGVMKGAGYNYKGRLGFETPAYPYKEIDFKVTGSPFTWKQVSSGAGHSIAICASEDFEDTLWGTGDNSYGQLGLGDTVERYEFTSIAGTATWKRAVCGTGYSILISLGGNRFYSAGYNSFGQLGTGGTSDRSSFLMIGSEEWLDISAGSHTMAVKIKGFRE